MHARSCDPGVDGSRPLRPSRAARCAVAAAAVALVLSCALPSRAAAADWKQVRTANFLFIGDVSDRHLRETARKLEQFRDVIGRLIPGAGRKSPVPTVVILFASERAFAPYQATRGGHRLDSVTGYFQPADTVNYISMNVARRDDAFRIVFHEYMHGVIANTITAVS